jgi:hypothetical protein
MSQQRMTELKQMYVTQLTTLGELHFKRLMIDKDIAFVESKLLELDKEARMVGELMQKEKEQENGKSTETTVQ